MSKEEKSIDDEFPYRPGHEARVAPVVLLGRVGVVGFTRKVGNTGFLRYESQLSGCQTRPRAAEGIFI